MRRRFSTGNRGRNSLASGSPKKVRRKMSLGSSLIINAESHGRPGWGGHFNHKDWKRNGRKMNVPQKESDLERLENAARSGDGVAQHRLAMIQCDGDLADYPYDDKSFQAGLEWLKHSAEQGNGFAAFSRSRSSRGSSRNLSSRSLKGARDGPLLRPSIAGELWRGVLHAGQGR